ncbi:MAG: orotidine-5'-phosphate decarboxylase [Planctomycetaceae bacterium]
MTWRGRFEARGSALCVGLDPVQERLPKGQDLRSFCLEVVDLTGEWACCFKPNAAFFERLGPPGMEAFAAVLRGVRERGWPVIADVKRGDIDSTAEAYADAYLGGPFDADAVTVNPSLGLDTLEPFRTRAASLDRGVFLLLRTSNPGAGQFQDAWEARLVRELRGDPRLGAVVGATDAGAARRLRAALPDTLFLVPGFGAQGGEQVGPLFDARGKGALVSSSRAILFAGEGRRDWKDAVRAAAREAHAAIERARAR